MNAETLVTNVQFQSSIAVTKPNLHTLSVFVNNKPGVLMRICQVFARRAYNIDALVVSHANNESLSRVTITISGAPEGLGQIIKQVNKLVDVIHCFEHSAEDSVTMEMALVKIDTKVENYLQISEAIQSFGGQIADCTEGVVIAMITGESEKLDWAIQVLNQFGVSEVVRTGKVVMARNRVKT